MDYGLVLFTSDRDGEPALYLHGPAGSGRTHLVQAVCSAAAARGQTTVRLGLAAEERLPLAARYYAAAAASAARGRVS